MLENKSNFADTTIRHSFKGRGYFTRLPRELIDSIVSFVTWRRGIGVDDLLSLGLTCRLMWMKVKESLKQRIVLKAGSWACDRLVLVGDYHDTPAVLENIELNSKEREILENASNPSDSLSCPDDDPTNLYQYRPSFGSAESFNLGRVSDSNFLEIERLQRSGSISDSMAKQMLAIAFPS